MFRPVCLFLSLVVFSTHSLAFEPELQQQGMFYINVSFDAGQTTKTKHHFGFRLDQGLVEPGQTMMLSTLVKKPAALDIQYTNTGMQAFNVHGINYLQEVLVARGAEAGGEETVVNEEPAADTTEAEAEQDTAVVEAAPVRDLDVKFGVVIGLAIGILAVAGSGN